VVPAFQHLNRIRVASCGFLCQDTARLGHCRLFVSFRFEQTRDLVVARWV
jgi:hypothetical protein